MICLRIYIYIYIAAQWKQSETRHGLPRCSAVYILRKSVIISKNAQAAPGGNTHWRRQNWSLWGAEDNFLEPPPTVSTLRSSRKPCPAQTESGHVPQEPPPPPARVNRHEPFGKPGPGRDLSGRTLPPVKRKKEEGGREVTIIKRGSQNFFSRLPRKFRATKLRRKYSNWFHIRITNLDEQEVNCPFEFRIYASISVNYNILEDTIKGWGHGFWRTISKKHRSNKNGSGLKYTKNYESVFL